MNPLIVLMFSVLGLMLVGPTIVFYCYYLRLPSVVFNVAWRAPMLAWKDFVEAVLVARHIRRGSYKMAKFMLLLLSFTSSEWLEQEITSAIFDKSVAPTWVSLPIAAVSGISIYYILAALARFSLSDVKDDSRMVVIIRMLKNHDYEYLRQYLGRHTSSEFKSFARFDKLNEKALKQLDGGQAEFERLMSRIPSDLFKE